MLAIHREMEGAVDVVRLLSDKLHDVDLAAAWPADARDVRAHGPDGRPNALALGEFRPHFDPAILPARPLPRYEAGGGVFNRFVVGRREMLFAAFNHQHAAFDPGILQ